MTAKTMRKRGNFDMKTLRRRVRKTLRVKFGKKIRLGEVDEIFKDWVQIEVTEPLIKYGQLHIDKKSGFEIVGKKKNIPILEKKTGEFKLTSQLNSLRPGLIYSIEITDKNFKGGKLLFNAHPDIKKQVTKALTETNNYYRIKE